MNPNLVIKGDDGSREEAEEDVFNLKTVQTHEDLEQILDAKPDFAIESEGPEAPKLPKYIKFEKGDKRIDDDANYENDDANYENDDEPELSMEEDSDNDLEQQGIGLSENEEETTANADKQNKKTKVEHSLIKSNDFRDKDTKPQQRVEVWFEKDNLQNLASDEDEDYDLDRLATQYKTKGSAVLGETTNNQTNTALPLGKKAKRRAKHSKTDETIRFFIKR